jgi:RsiW-degrading membrane proteinase PrsW (M82 family)
MNIPLVLLGIILASSLPLVIVYIWFRLAKFQISFYWFLLTLLAGATALFPALLMQELLTPSFQDGRSTLFFNHFVRIALTEELSRFFVLLIFFWICSRISPLEYKQPVSFKTINKATATGLIAGLGFALIETAIYAASDINVLPLRIVLTAAIHGACGSRIGAAAVMIRSNPFQAILRLLTATAIHGIYNMMVTMSGFSALAAILIAISAMLMTILTIIGGQSEDVIVNQTKEETAGELDKKA